MNIGVTALTRMIRRREGTKTQASYISASPCEGGMMFEARLLIIATFAVMLIDVEATAVR